jgi:pentatricopeptide repeat protein
MDVLSAFWVEIVMTLLALIGYSLFNGVPGLAKNDEKVKSEVNELDVAKSIQMKYEAKEYRAVVTLWEQVKQNNISHVALSVVVDAMKRMRMETNEIINELKAGIQAVDDLRDISVINGLLEGLVKEKDVDLLDAVLDMLSSVDIQPDFRSYEVLFNAHLSLQNYNEIKSLAMRLKKQKFPFTQRMRTVVFRTALTTGQFGDALSQLQEMETSDISALSPQLIMRMVYLGCKQNRVADVLSKVGDVAKKISTDTFNTVLEDIVKQKDAQGCKQLQDLCSEWGVQKNVQTFLLLIKGQASEVSQVRSVLDEVQACSAMTEAIALVALDVCAAHRDASLAMDVFQNLKKQATSSLAAPGHAVFAALVQVYQQCEEHELVCKLYEDEMAPAKVFPDTTLSGLLMNSAMHQKRTDLTQILFEKSPSDIAKHMTMIRACARERNLAGALDVFKKLEASGTQMSTLMYNCFLDACVQCGSLEIALTHFEKMKELEVVDVVSYNTLMKAYLQAGEIRKARDLMFGMSKHGIKANKVTYNELLNGLVSIKDRRGMWQLISEMMKDGVMPNSVTCSIILKSLNANSHPSDIQRAMELVENMSDSMDEVLFSSVIEACIRIGKLDVLSAKLQQYASRGGFKGLTSPTYGSMIKAYGHAHDIDRVWELWREMRSRDVKPTAITLGCMVDALVTNGCVEDALELVRETLQDEQCKDTVNTVIYSTILKGFSREKLPDRVYSVYQEMKKHSIACNTITYNTIINSNARTGRMDRVDELFHDMAASGVSPDIITYSTVVKGHCMAGDVDKGFKVLKEMLKQGKYEPDEILYNSLLDGCAKQHRVEEALELLQTMRKTGVQPSNFTLSIIVKLLGRSRQLNQAFATVEEICKEYGFQANIHVYTCLLQACIHNRQLQRALKLHDSMILEANVQPDAKTYSALVRGCLQVGSLEKAEVMVRVAYGLDVTGVAKPRRAPGMEHRVLEEVMGALSSNPVAERLAVPLLAELRSIGVQVERNVYSRAVQSSSFRPQRKSNPVQQAFAESRERKNSNPVQQAFSEAREDGWQTKSRRR